MNALDRVVSFFSPAAGLARVRARHAIRLYEGAAVGRRASSWRATHTSANAEIGVALRPLRDRARDLARNTPHAARMLDIIVSHAVGTGIVPVWDTGSDRLDRRVEQLWEDWQRCADVTGQLSYYAMQALGVRSMIESGESVTRFISVALDDETRVPLKLQLLESDYIDQWRDGLYGEKRQGAGLPIKSRLGVGLGEFDKRLGLWLLPYHPGEITTINMVPGVSSFIPSDEIIHMFRVLRPGQVRGVPWFAPILTTARELADFLDAVNVKARVEACFTGFITNDDSTQPVFDPAQNPSYQGYDVVNPGAGVTSLEPGMLKELRAGQDIKFAQPTTTSQVDPVIMYNLQAMAAGAGCTYDQVTGDLRGANYSSLKAGKVEFRRLVEQLQHHVIIPMDCRRVERQFVAYCKLAGYLPDRKAPYDANWVTPAWEPIDPQRDLQADIQAVRAGRTTPQQFIASWGGDWRRVMDDTAAFFKRADAKGVVFDIDPRRVDQSGRQPPATVPEDDETPKPDAGDDLDGIQSSALEGGDGNPPDE